MQIITRCVREAVDVIAPLKHGCASRWQIKCNACGNGSNLGAGGMVVGGVAEVVWDWDSIRASLLRRGEYCELSEFGRRAWLRLAVCGVCVTVRLARTTDIARN